VRPYDMSYGPFRGCVTGEEGIEGGTFAKPPTHEALLYEVIMTIFFEKSRHAQANGA
jgi:hypothetical protein